MNEPFKTAKVPSPIYISLPRLEKVIELVSNRTLTTVKASYFQGHGFNPSDSFLAISSLRFLGLIDAENTSTESMAKLRLQGDARKREFEKIVREAYKKLFEVSKTPYNLPPDELSNEMVIQYNLSKGVITPAVSAFRRLCVYAGLLDEGTVVAQKRSIGKAKAPVIPKPKKAVQIAETSAIAVGGFAPVPVAEGRMVLLIPALLKDKILDDESLGADWNILRKELRTFADKYIPKQEQKKQTPGSVELET